MGIETSVFHRYMNEETNNTVANIPKTLPIRRYPDEILKKSCHYVKEEEISSERIQVLINQMIETAKAQRAEGLAANQVGERESIIIIKDYFAGEEGQLAEDRYLVFINPEGENKGNRLISNEGCLSFPGIEARVPRCDEVAVTALDRDGRKVTVTLVGVSAVAFQHEMDHLNGITFLERVGPTEKRLLLAKLQKQQRKTKKLLQRIENQIRINGNTLTP